MTAIHALALRRAFPPRLGPTAAARLAPLAPTPLRAGFATSAIARDEKRRPAGPSAYGRGGTRAAFARPRAMREADSREEAYEEAGEEDTGERRPSTRNNWQRGRGRDAAPVDPLTTRNWEIPFETVQLVGEDKKLSEPLPLQPILESIDMATESVICVQAEPPVVKIVNNADEKRKERERDERIRLSKRLAIDDKELQMGWGAADGDVQHKIDTAVDLLKKGDRVHIVFALRASSGGKKQRVPDERKMQILEMFEEGVADVAKKWKDDEQSRGLWIQHWTPKESVITEARAKIVVGGVEKRKVRDERKEARRLKEEERARKAKERQEAELAK
jgi:translation initiation factor IF-3